MRKLLLSLTILAGAAGAASAASTAPLHPEAAVAPQVQTVQYYSGGHYREWRRHDGYERWRRHEAWRRWHHHHRGW